MEGSSYPKDWKIARADVTGMALLATEIFAGQRMRPGERHQEQESTCHRSPFLASLESREESDVEMVIADCPLAFDDGSIRSVVS